MNGQQDVLSSPELWQIFQRKRQGSFFRQREAALQLIHRLQFAPAKHLQSRIESIRQRERQVQAKPEERKQFPVKAAVPATILPKGSADKTLRASMTSLLPDIPVGGRLKYFVKAWKKLTSADDQIAMLLAKKAIVPTASTPGEFTNTIFLRPKRDGGFRTILNLKKVQQVHRVLTF